MLIIEGLRGALNNLDEIIALIRQVPMWKPAKAD
jgi:DNA gyrase/topoisomerase IV subunit A